MSAKQTPLELAQFLLRIAGDEERIEVELAREVVRLSNLPEAASRLALLGIERMIESVKEDLRNQDPGDHAIIGALNGEGKGLIAAKMLLEGAMRGHHGDHVARPQLHSSQEKP